MGQFDFRQIQIGTEVVGCGTLALATYILHGDMSIERRTTIQRRPPVAILSNFGRQFVTQQEVGLTYKSDLTVEEILYLLHMGVDGTVLGVGVAPTVWTYTKALTAEPTLQCFTIEYGDDAGACVVNGVVAESLEFAGSLGGGEALSMQGNLYGWTKAPQALTPIVGGELAITPIPANFSRLWIDNTWAALGTNELDCDQLAWRFTLPCSYPVWRGTNLYPTGYGIESTHGTLELSLEHNVNSIAEIANIEPGTPRFVRIQAAASALAIFQVDMCVTWDPETIFEADRGDNLVPLTGQTNYDPTGTNEVEFTISNSVVLLP